MHTRLAAIALIVALTVSGCSLRPRMPEGPAPTQTSAAASVPATPSIAAVKPDTQAIPDVNGMTGAEARDALKDAGFKYEYDAGDSYVFKASNWTVVAHNPMGEAKVGTTITLTVTKPEVAPAPPKAVTELDEVNAAQFLANSWVDRFPYGGKVHWILDRITTPNADGTWTFKIGATLKDEYGNKIKATIEGDVGGTNDAPIILDSILYTSTGEIFDFYG